MFFKTRKRKPEFFIILYDVEHSRRCKKGKRAPENAFSRMENMKNPEFLAPEIRGRTYGGGRYGRK
jgi:hypothetical protein